MTGAPCVIGVADHAGWAHVVCVAARGNIPAVIHRRKVTLIDRGLPTLPYHHESIGMPVDDANALIARVRQSIAGCASRALQSVVTELAPEYSAVALAIREAPFPALPDTVAEVHQSYRLQCAADGVMYQLALCRAAQDLRLQVHRCRRGEEAARAAARLAVQLDDLESFIAREGRPPGPPWTDEHRRAFAASIAVLAAHAPALSLVRGGAA